MSPYAIYGKPNKGVQKLAILLLSPFSIYFGYAFPSERFCVDCGAFYAVEFCGPSSHVSVGTFLHSLNVCGERRASTILNDGTAFPARPFDLKLGSIWLGPDLALLKPFDAALCAS